MENLNILLTIQSLLNSFTKAERRVADLVLEKPESISNNSITNLAEIAGVGDTSVVRFCRKLGFKGYQSFKMTMVKELAFLENKAVVLIEEGVEENDSLDSIMMKICSNYIKSIENTKDMINVENLDKIIDCILKAESINFYGLVTSGTSAQDAKHKLTRLGLKADAFTDGHSMAMNAVMLNKKQVAIGISHSGSTIDLISAMKLAKEAGAVTIAITHYLKSPITKYCDYILVTTANENPAQAGSLSQKICQMFIIDVLFTSILAAKKDSLEMLGKTGKALDDKLY